MNVGILPYCFSRPSQEVPCRSELTKKDHVSYWYRYCIWEEQNGCSVQRKITVQWSKYSRRQKGCRIFTRWTGVSVRFCKGWHVTTRVSHQVANTAIEQLCITFSWVLSFLYVQEAALWYTNIPSLCCVCSKHSCQKCENLLQILTIQMFLQWLFSIDFKHEKVWKVLSYHLIGEWVEVSENSERRRGNYPSCKTYSGILLWVILLVSFHDENCKAVRWKLEIPFFSQINPALLQWLI